MTQGEAKGHTGLREAEGSRWPGKAIPQGQVEILDSDPCGGPRAG